MQYVKPKIQMVSVKTFAAHPDRNIRFEYQLRNNGEVGAGTADASNAGGSLCANAASLCAAASRTWVEINAFNTSDMGCVLCTREDVLLLCPSLRNQPGGALGHRPLSPRQLAFTLLRMLPQSDPSPAGDLVKRIADQFAPDSIQVR